MSTRFHRPPQTCPWLLLASLLASLSQRCAGQPLTRYTEQGIDTHSILASFADVLPTLKLIEGEDLTKATPRLEPSSGGGAITPRPSPALTPRPSPPAHGGAPNTAAAGSADSRSVCLLSLLDDDTKYTERAQRRAGEGTRDDKLLERVQDKLEKLAGYVRRDGKRWDERSGSWQQLVPRFRDVSVHGAKQAVSFAVSHFGSTVPYCVSGFCDKNVDPLDKELLELMQSADANGNAEFMRHLFGQPASERRSLAFKFRDEMDRLVQVKACPRFSAPPRRAAPPRFAASLLIPSLFSLRANQPSQIS